MNRSKSCTAPETVAATLETSACTEALSLRIYGVRVGIRTNQPEVFERLAPYLPPTWQQLSHSRMAALDRVYSLHVGHAGSTKTGGPFHQVFEGQEAGLRSPDLEAVLEDFERRVKIYVAEMAPRRVFVHAGAVGWKGRAIVIPGRSFSGKTTLVTELVRAGATYYSDEYAVIDGRGRVHPYPQALAIRQPGSGRQIRNPVATIGGAEGVRPLPVGLVVVTHYQEGARWRPRTLSAGQAVLELLAHTVPARRRPEVVMPTLGATVSDAISLKGARGEASGVARLVLEQLERAKAASK